MKIGNINSNDYVDINETDGVILKGDTTTWDDIQGSLFGSKEEYIK